MERKDVFENISEIEKTTKYNFYLHLFLEGDMPTILKEILKKNHKPEDLVRMTIECDKIIIEELARGD